MVYRLTDGAAGGVEKKFSLTRFFARVDSSDRPDEYLLFQAGKFFPLYAVDQANETYTRLTPAVTPRLGPAPGTGQVADAAAEKKDDPAAPENEAEDLPAKEFEQQAEAEGSAGIAPAIPLSQATESGGSGAAGPGTAQSEAPAEGASDVPPAKSTRRTAAAILKPTKKTRSVAGIECRVVDELIDGKPAIEHCMANSARLKVTDRELITLARSFGMARNMEFGWLGVGTRDEEFVSVQSRDLRDERLLELTSVSTQPLAEGYLRIPKTHRLVESGSGGG
jgi:hypothetical protein